MEVHSGAMEVYSGVTGANSQKLKKKTGLDPGRACRQFERRFSHCNNTAKKKEQCKFRSIKQSFLKKLSTHKKSESGTCSTGVKVFVFCILSTI